MKKFIAIGITALGSFGLLGLGATSAFAASGKTQVCAAANVQLTNLTPSKVVANTAEGVTALAVTAANTAVGVSEGAFTNAFIQVVKDLDVPVSPQLAAAHTASFNTAGSSLITDLVNQSAANVAEFNAVKTLDQATLLDTFYNDIKTAEGC